MRNVELSTKSTQHTLKRMKVLLHKESLTMLGTSECKFLEVLFLNGALYLCIGILKHFRIPYLEPSPECFMLFTIPCSRVLQFATFYVQFYGFLECPLYMNLQESHRSAYTGCLIIFGPSIYTALRGIKMGMMLCSVRFQGNHISGLGWSGP